MLYNPFLKLGFYLLVVNCFQFCNNFDVVQLNLNELLI